MLAEGVQPHGRHMPIPRFVARFNRFVTNPLARLISGWLPPFAIVAHRGRVSGRTYHTPVWAFRTKDGLAIALTYGSESDWAKNVLLAGSCDLRRAGRPIHLREPRLGVCELLDLRATS
jgi:hypothetical protein